jgi:hypothetical protein
MRVSASRSRPVIGFLIVLTLCTRLLVHTDPHPPREQIIYQPALDLELLALEF